MGSTGDGRSHCLALVLNLPVFSSVADDNSSLPIQNINEIRRGNPRQWAKREIETADDVGLQVQWTKVTNYVPPSGHSPEAFKIISSVKLKFPYISHPQITCKVLSLPSSLNGILRCWIWISQNAISTGCPTSSSYAKGINTSYCENRFLFIQYHRQDKHCRLFNWKGITFNLITL